MCWITFPGLCTTFIKFASCILFCFLSDSADHGSWHFVAGSGGSCALNIHFVVRSCRSWISKVGSVWRSWWLWILRILDSKVLLHREILEILYLVLLSQRDPGDPGSETFVLWWDPGDIGSWQSDFVVGPCRSWILIFYFVVGSCGSWILFFGCGTCLGPWVSALPHWRGQYSTSPL